MFKFAENQTLESLDSVPDNLRGFYAEGEGGYSIPEALAPAAEAWDGVNNANAAIRRENKSLKGGKVDLSALSAYGSSVDEIAETVNARITELSETIDSKKNLVNPEKIRAQMTEGFEETKKTYETRIGALEGQLYELKITREATDAIIAEKGNPKLLMPFITKQVKMIEEDGQLHARVVDEYGEIVYGATGLPMTVKELVSKMKTDKDYMPLFESKQTTGGGAPTNRGNAPTPGVPVHERDAVSNIAAGLKKRGLR